MCKYRPDIFLERKMRFWLNHSEKKSRLTCQLKLEKNKAERKEREIKSTLVGSEECVKILKVPLTVVMR